MDFFFFIQILMQDRKSGIWVAKIAERAQSKDKNKQNNNNNNNKNKQKAKMH